MQRLSSKMGTNNWLKLVGPIFCGKAFENIVFKYSYNQLSLHNLIIKNQSGLRQGDSTIKQLIDFVNEIPKYFDNKQSLEVRPILLDISMAFDKGLMFKLKQNDVRTSS